MITGCFGTRPESEEGWNQEPFWTGCDSAAPLGKTILERSNGHAHRLEGRGKRFVFNYMCNVILCCSTLCVYSADKECGNKVSGAPPRPFKHLNPPRHSISNWPEIFWSLRLRIYSVCSVYYTLNSYTIPWIHMRMAFFNCRPDFTRERLWYR